MNWLRLRMARIEIDERKAREKSHLALPSSANIMDPGIMKDQPDEASTEDVSSDLPTEVLQNVSASNVVQVQHDHIHVDKDVTDDDDSDSSECDDVTVLRERLRQQRRVIRGLKRKLQTVETENELLKVQSSISTAEPATPMQLDPKALVAEITQAATETAAQLDTAGFTYQPETGLYYDPQSGYYWDSSRQMYYDGNTGYYLSYDATSGQYSYVDGTEASATDQHESKAVHDGQAEDVTRPKNNRRQRPRAGGSDAELEDGELDDSEGEEAGEVVETAVPYWNGYETAGAPSAASGYRSSAHVQCPVDRRQLPARSCDVPMEYCSGPLSPRSSRDPPWLRMVVVATELDSVRYGSLYIVTIDGATIGRDASQQICLPEPSLSKFHAVIVYHAETLQYRIRDLGSRNGSFIDDHRISASKQESEDVQLPHGCRLRVGSTHLLCHVHAATDTCLQCEPGHVQSLFADPTPNGDASEQVATSSDTSRQQRRAVAERIKRKYGLRNKDGAVGGLKLVGYQDRAARRRTQVGSSSVAEKTVTADPDLAIPMENKGFKMLQKMGWKEGSGLGREGQGEPQPISVQERDDRRGLGCSGPPIPVVAKKLQQKGDIWRKTQERFNKIADSKPA